MKRNTVFLSLLTTISFIILSGFTSFPGDAKAEQILKNSKATFEGLEDFSATFTYSLSNPTKPQTKIEKTGALAYSDGKYAVKMDDQEIYCNGETIWIYLPDEENPEVNIMDYDPEEGLDIESIFDLYQANANPRYDGEVNLHGNVCHQIYLAVTDKALEYNQAKVWINKKSQLPEKAITINRMQTNTTYEFTDIKTDQGLPISTFEFVPEDHPEVAVIDER